MHDYNYCVLGNICLFFSLHLIILLYCKINNNNKYIVQATIQVLYELFNIQIAFRFPGIIAVRIQPLYYCYYLFIFMKSANLHRNQDVKCLFIVGEKSYG